MGLRPSESPLYAIWLLSETVEGMAELAQRYKDGDDCLSQAS